MSPFVCPNCQHHVHLPEGVASEATVQCPLCGYATQVSQLSRSVGPTWIVMEPGDSSLTNSSAESLSVSAVSPGILRDTISSVDAVSLGDAVPADTGIEQGTDISIRSSGSNDGVGYELAQDALPKADRTRKQPLKQQDWTKHQPLSHDEYQRRKRKSSSPLQGILQIGLGGALALPIAQLLIWHVLGKDPFELAPKVGAYAPWVVPYKFRPYPTDREESKAFTPKANTKAKSGSGIGRDFDAELAQALAESQRNLGPSREAASASVDLAEMRQSELADTSKADKAESRETESEVQEVVPSESEKLTLAIAKTREAMQAWSAVAKDDNAERRKVANNFYSNLSLSVEHFAKIEGEPSARLMKREIEKLIRDIRENAELLQLVRAGGFAKLSKQDDVLPAGKGLALIASFVAPETESNSGTSKEETSDAAASDRSDWTVEVRKTWIADSNETPENIRRREVSLHRDVQLGEEVSGDYLILAVTPAEMDSEAIAMPRDQVWFAIPIL